jgi:hypothetical protein
VQGESASTKPKTIANNNQTGNRISMCLRQLNLRWNANVNFPLSILT